MRRVPARAVRRCDGPGPVANGHAADRHDRAAAGCDGRHGKGPFAPSLKKAERRDL